MRILLIVASLLFLASCTVGNTDTKSPGVSGGMTQSLISKSDTYNPELQKTLPSPVYGSGRHDITIYADFQCPACISFSDGLGSLLESYAASGMTTLTFKQFPLTTIHVNAYRDAIAGLCAAEQDMYMPAKKALYAMEKAKAGAKVTDAERISTLVAV